MIVELIDGIGREPLRLQGSQVVIRNDVGTPVVVAGEYGPPGALRVAKAGDEDFNAILRAFGYGPVDVSMLTKQPVPAGARLLAGPGV